MRATNNPTPNEVSERLVQIANKYNLPTADILIDLYSAFSSKGQTLDLADPKVLDSLKDKDPTRYWSERDAFYKARVVLGDIVNSPLFNTFKALPPLEAVESVAELMELLNRKMKSFMDSAKKNWKKKEEIVTKRDLDRGKNSIAFNTDEELEAYLDSVKDADLQKHNAKVSVSEFLDNLKKTLDAFDSGIANALLNTPISQGPGGHAAGITLSRGGAGTSPFVIPFGVQASRADAEWLVKQVKSFILRGGLVLWEAIQNIGNKAGFEEKSKNTTDNITKDRKDDTMTKTEEVTSASAIDIQREDFDKKLVERNLEVTKHTSSDAERAHCIVLFDVSGSMGAVDTAANRLDRYGYAAMLTIAMAHKVVDRGDNFYIVPFAGQPQPIIPVTNKAEAANAINKCLHGQSFGGTSLVAAVNRAYEYINKEKHYRRCDIVIITDAEDHFHYKTLRDNKPEKTRIIGIHVGDSVTDDQKGRLKLLSDKGRFLRGGWDVVNNMPDIEKALKGL